MAKYLNDTALAELVNKIKVMVNTKQDVITSTNKLDYSLIDNTPTIPSAVTSINGLSGGTLTSPLTITGGDSATASKIILDTNGQITDTSTATLFGRSGTGSTLIVGHGSYVMTMRGSATRPTYNGSNLALVSDIPDTTSSVTSGSTAALTSGGAYTALSNKQDTLTFDTTPTFNSSNPVTSGGVYTALSTKQTTLTAGDNITIQNNVISATGGGGGGMTGIELVNKNEDIITSITRTDGNNVNNLSNIGGGSYLRIKLNKTLTWTNGKFYQINIWNSLSSILTQCSGTFCGFYIAGLTQYNGFVGIWNTANAVNSAVLTNLFIPYSKKEIDIGLPSTMPTSETDNLIANFDKFKFEIIEY